jgi:hypothetical protein
MCVTGKSSASPQAIQPSRRTVSETWYVRQRISQWRRFGIMDGKHFGAYFCQRMRDAATKNTRVSHRLVGPALQTLFATVPLPR